MEKQEIVFVPKQVIVEFWISFQDHNDIETGIIIKKLADGNYLIPSGKRKKTFTLKEIEQPTNHGEFLELPFALGITDLHSPYTIKPQTFASFLEGFRKVFFLLEDEKENM